MIFLAADFFVRPPPQENKSWVFDRRGARAKARKLAPLLRIISRSKITPSQNPPRKVTTLNQDLTVAKGCD